MTQFPTKFSVILGQILPFLPSGGRGKFFFENRALLFFSYYNFAPLCKKLEKSLEPFSRKTKTNQPTNQPTNQLTNILSSSSTGVENCNAGDQLAQRQKKNLEK